ncbi:MAG: hypothetical protein LBR69_03020 [Endomicrobium sp.]|jgi:hypothetical protein|nr:hypothetical protein [Endomicrobium sp.]
MATELNFNGAVDKKSISCDNSQIGNSETRCLTVKNLPEGDNIAILMSNDSENYIPMPKDDANDFVITKNGAYALAAGNWTIKAVYSGEEQGNIKIRLS